MFFQNGRFDFETAKFTPTDGKSTVCGMPRYNHETDEKIKQDLNSFLENTYSVIMF